MKKTICCALLALVATFAHTTENRPEITGIDHVDFYTTAPEANRDFYTVSLGLNAAEPSEPDQAERFMIGTQWVGYSPAPAPKATSRMDHIAFRTDNCEALRR